MHRASVQPPWQAASDSTVTRTAGRTRELSSPHSVLDVSFTGYCERRRHGNQGRTPIIYLDSNIDRFAISGRSRRCSLGLWIYPGQTLLLPGAFVDHGNGYGTYTVARGETLRFLADRFGTSIAALGSLNGLTNFDLIYEGQRLTVPSGSAVPAPSPYPQPEPVSAGKYVVQWGDAMRGIADRLGVSLADLSAMNPEISNPSVIYFGQVLRVPASASVYAVQRGDTLRMISTRFNSNIDDLMMLNPQIWNANWIYAGQVIRVR